MSILDVKWHRIDRNTTYKAYHDGYTLHVHRIHPRLWFYEVRHHEDTVDFNEHKVITREQAKYTACIIALEHTISILT